jgi:hypothetical protein
MWGMPIAGPDLGYHECLPKGCPTTVMRFYIFKSETTTTNLRAFAGDVLRTKLRESHAPWSMTGVVANEAKPPHDLSRVTIEAAIQAECYQLWQLTSNREALKV